MASAESRQHPLYHTLCTLHNNAWHKRIKILRWKVSRETYLDMLRADVEAHPRDEHPWFGMIRRREDEDDQVMTFRGIPVAWTDEPS